MSISSSLFSGISGLSTNGNAMSVIGDNIANVNTIGFKSSRTTFQDVLAQSVATSAGTAQIGRGASLSAIDTLFQQGSFESTSSATDLAIGGNGFFIVSPRTRRPNTSPGPVSSGSTRTASSSTLKGTLPGAGPWTTPATTWEPCRIYA